MKEGERFDVYKLQGNKAAYNDELYNMMIAHPGDDKYFLEYKAMFGKEEWERKWEELLTEFKGKLIAINSWLYIKSLKLETTVLIGKRECAAQIVQSLSFRVVRILPR